jgi:hypothetical protein
LAVQRNQILVVQDDAIVAMWITDLLLESGLNVLGPAPNARLARRWLRLDPDAALIDVQVADREVWSLANEFLDARLPLVLLCGSQTEVPTGFEDVPRVSKLTLGETLIPGLESILSVTPAAMRARKASLPLWS